MINAISTALAGLNSATQKVNESANNIANFGTDPNNEGDITTDIVKLNLAEVEYKANLITLEAASELSDELGKLFDEKV